MKQRKKMKVVKCFSCGRKCDPQDDLCACGKIVCVQCCQNFGHFFGGSHGRAEKPTKKPKSSRQNAKRRERKRTRLTPQVPTSPLPPSQTLKDNERAAFAARLSRAIRDRRIKARILPHIKSYEMQVEDWR